jgi:ATP-dependent DNA helicase RecG
LPPVPARNRRIGEFFKELRLAEMRGTGIPKIKRAMEENGSDEPTFDFDQQRTYFRVILPAHPKYKILHTLRESSYLWSIGEKKSALLRLQSVFSQQPGYGAVAGQLIEYYSDLGDIISAEKTFYKFYEAPKKYEVEQPYLKFFKALYSHNEHIKAREIIELLPEKEYFNSPYEVALAFKRIKILDKAHMILMRIYDSYENDPGFLHNLAQVKIGIASEIYYRNKNLATVLRLRKEAVSLLRKVIYLSDDNVQKGWAYFDLARTLKWMKVPKSEVQEAFESATNLLPNERKFAEAYQKWKEYNVRKK